MLESSIFYFIICSLLLLFAFMIVNTPSLGFLYTDSGTCTNWNLFGHISKMFFLSYLHDLDFSYCFRQEEE